MAKVEVFCLIRKRTMLIEQKLADALVKMKRASYENVKVIEPRQARRSYQTKVTIPEQTPMVADTSFTPYEDVVTLEVAEVVETIEEEINPVVPEVTPVLIEDPAVVENVEVKKRGRRKKDAE